MAQVVVGMPAYNAEEHVGPAIESVLSQSYGDLELIISDNASTDATGDICRDFAKRDSRVSYVLQPQNLGATANYNLLPSLADAPYFKWHSSNDTLSSNLLEDCIAALEKDDSVVLAFPQTCLVTADESAGERYDDKLDMHCDAPVERFLQVIDNMRLNNVMNGVVRLDALTRTALLHEFYYADRNLVAELSLYGKLRLVPDAIFYRRMDEQSATSHKSEGEVLAHFDPSRKRPLAFTHWRIYFRYLTGLLSSPIPVAQKLKGFGSLLRRAVWARGHLMRDVTVAASYLTNDIRSAVSRSSSTERH